MMQIAIAQLLLFLGLLSGIPALVNARPNTDSIAWRYRFVPGVSHVYRFSVDRQTERMTTDGLQRKEDRSNVSIRVTVLSLNADSTATVEFERLYQKDTISSGSRDQMFPPYLRADITEMGQVRNGQVVGEDSLRDIVRRLRSIPPDTSVHLVANNNLVARYVALILPQVQRSRLEDGMEWIDTVYLKGGMGMFVYFHAELLPDTLGSRRFRVAFLEDDQDAGQAPNIERMREHLRSRDASTIESIEIRASDGFPYRRESSYRANRGGASMTVKGVLELLPDKTSNGQ